MTTYVQDYNHDGTPKRKKNGLPVWVDRSKREFGPDGHPDIAPVRTHAVISDIADYQSVITGERIHGRAHHRAHLKQHNCIEMGNETPQSAQKHFKPKELSSNERIRDVKDAYEKLEANG